MYNAVFGLPSTSSKSNTSLKMENLSMATSNRMVTPKQLACTLFILLALQCTSCGSPFQTCDPLSEYWNDATERCELCAKLCFPGLGNPGSCSEKCSRFLQLTTVKSTPSTTNLPPSEKNTLALAVGISVGVSVALIAVAFAVSMIYKKRSSIRLWFKTLRMNGLTRGQVVTEEQGDRSLHVIRTETEAMMKAGETET